MKLLALDPKNQALVNEADKYLTKYFLLNDMKEIAIESQNNEEAQKLDQLCDVALDNFWLACEGLPLSEVEMLERYLYY